MLLPQALTTLAAVGVVWASGYCETFKELRRNRLTSYRCYKNCIKEADPFDVYGTELYHEDSQVCTAARHIGAIPDSGGTFDVIKHTDELPHTLYGTTKNRVLSRTKDTSGSTAVYEIRRTTASVTEEDMRGDVVMVHNAYASEDKRTLSVTCLAQDPTTRLTRDSMASWGYYRGGDSGSKVTRLKYGRLVLSTRENYHAFRCLGRSSATDVLAAVPYPDGSYHSRSPSVRFSKNQEVIIPLDKKPNNLPDSVFVRRPPDGWSPRADHTLPLRFGPATLNLSGVYIVHSDERKRDSNGAFFDVIIRECEDGMYGVDCDRQCPYCQHGGQCHPQTGTCVCPPGFMGDTCQHACPPGSFGADCQLRCEEETLGFANTRGSDCRGLVICVPEPYGCSCSPGYTYSEGEDYPVCTAVCAQGKYGADCSETCTGCKNDHCDRFTGACLNGCRGGVDCSQEPGPPESITSARKSRQLDLTVHMPTEPGGRLVNCSLTLTNIPEPCTLTYTDGPSHSTCRFTKLQPGKKFLARARCCNSKFCGEEREQPVATLPHPPQISGKLGVVRKTNTTITLSLPPVVTYGDGNSFMAVVVQKADQHIENLEAVAQKLLSESRQQTSGREARQIQSRQAGPDRLCQQPVWIAGRVDQDITMFDIGDGVPQEEFYNCPLQYQHQYIIGIMAVMDLLGELSYDWSVLPEPVLVEPWSPAPIPWSVILPILLIITILVAVTYFVYRRHAGVGASVIFCKENSQQIPDDANESPDENTTSSQAPLRLPIQLRSPAGNDMQHADTLQGPTFDQNNIPASLSQSTGELAISESTYDNICPEQIYEDLRRRIPRGEVEAYLNMTIGSRTAAEEFRSVPRAFSMPMDTGHFSANNPKNRHNNNLPYDDTRVVLSTINNDPNSDYINANHVTGYGKMRYIAAQGPKDANVPTIADFWRMVIEQRVTAVIMVANFVEGGKSKVGEYFRAGITLEFDGYFVSVLSSEQLPNFTVSSLRVIKDGYSYDVKHYQYLSWPDHGIPNEAGSVALMVKHFLSNHSQGCTVVHCSAGIGGTGTMLQVLLMYEMLTLEGSFDPLEVLRFLRSCRARLVENQAQYNLSLEIFEEVLFGEETTVKACDLKYSLESCLKKSAAQFRKVKHFPSSLTYKNASNPSFQSMNRDLSVLPADTRRICLQMEFGEPDSQYINAVQIPRLNQEEEILVTEHPLPATLSKFWRLVVEKRCSLVILANNFDEQRKMEFPDVIPAVGGRWTVGDYTVHAEEAQPRTAHLMCYIINITNPKNLKHRVELFQVLTWMYDQDVPSDPDVLVTLAEILLQNRGGAHVGPPLVSCGNGVTGCGLVAAMTLLVESVQNEQRVDVYRTVRKLLRSRPQFITSETQFGLLYSGASTYINNYSTYGNFL